MVSGALVAAVGGTAVASATRADLDLDGELTRAAGDPHVIRRTVTRESVTYLPSSDEVRTDGRTVPFDRWARRECRTVGADRVVTVVEERLGRPVESVGSGVRHLVFGPVVTVDHVTTRDRDGEVRSEPDVPVDRLVSTAPRTLTVTVALADRSYTTTLPVGVGQAEMSAD